MKLVDVNLLLYAVNEDAHLHSQAKDWLSKVLTGSETVGFAWVVLLAFLRLSTRQAVFAQPLSPEASFELLNTWLSQPCATIVQPGDKHLKILGELVRQLGTGGNLISDAHLGALAIEYGAELCSADSDFARFPGLSWRNPLAAAK